MWLGHTLDPWTSLLSDLSRPFSAKLQVKIHDNCRNIGLYVRFLVTSYLFGGNGGLFALDTLKRRSIWLLSAPSCRNSWHGNRYDKMDHSRWVGNLFAQNVKVSYSIKTPRASDFACMTRNGGIGESSDSQWGSPPRDSKRNVAGDRKGQWRFRSDEHYLLAFSLFSIKIVFECWLGCLKDMSTLQRVFLDEH